VVELSGVWSNDIQVTPGLPERAETGGGHLALLSRELVRRGLPRPIGVGVWYDTEGEAPQLLAPEEAVLGPRAIERRRRFFAIGRAAARQALAEIGVQPVPIGRGLGGEPLWPEGVVGAISHAGNVALAIVGRRGDYAGLGVDIEELWRGPSARAARLICRPSEMEWADVSAGTERLAMLFSAKEAVFKAVFPIEGVWLGFGDAELTWQPERGAFAALLLKSPGVGYPVGTVLEVFCSIAGGLVLSTTYCEPEPSRA
jgi:4'-phosphopantetheinyl transferase EntD